MQIKIEITGARASGKTEVLNKLMAELNRIGKVTEVLPGGNDMKDTTSCNFKPSFDPNLIKKG